MKIQNLQSEQHMDRLGRLLSSQLTLATPELPHDISERLRDATEVWWEIGMAIDDMEAGEEQVDGKRTPQDFALWKAAKAGEPATATWPTCHLTPQKSTPIPSGIFGIANARPCKLNVARKLGERR
jgi:hypothetical protein